MALLKNITKPEQNVRLTAMIQKPLLRKAHAYRLFIEKENGGDFCPALAQVLEGMLSHLFTEDKAFAKWYEANEKAMPGLVDALIKGDATKPAPKDDDAS